MNEQSVKFIRAGEKIFNVCLLESAIVSGHKRSFTLKISDHVFTYPNTCGFLSSAFGCFMENLHSNDLTWRNLFDLDEYERQGVEIKKSESKAIDDFEKGLVVPSGKIN